MKKILKWVFPALLGIVPAMGADNSYQEETNFLKGEKGSTVTVIGLRSILINEKPIDQVRVERSDGRKKYITLKLFEGGITSKNWQYNDETLEGYPQTTVALVLPNDDEINQTIEGEKTPYTLESSEEVTLLNGSKINNAIPLGSVVDICSQGQYLRPDKSLYLTNTPLYSAKALIYHNEQQISPKDFLNEAVGTQAEVATFLCVNDQVGEKKETLYPIILTQRSHYSQFIRDIGTVKEPTFRGFKTRYCWEIYDVHMRITEIVKVIDGKEISLDITKTKIEGVSLRERDSLAPRAKNRDHAVGTTSLPPSIGEESYTGI